MVARRQPRRDRSDGSTLRPRLHPSRRQGDQTLEDFKRILNGLHSGFPDLRSEVVDIVEEGDRVAYRWVSTGTHLGDYLGAPPTGRTVTASGITISRFENGRIVEDWASWNEVSVLHSIGVLPIDR
ncbi:ester cyclase [Leucobacter soli]|uniref:ester cyclase n=1 Tax=Leucobacter soli TaxID=2812850 RepID=UPI0036187B8A